MEHPMERRMRLMLVSGIALFRLSGAAHASILECSLETPFPVQFQKMEITVRVRAPFRDPYDSREIRLDMLVRLPSGGRAILPCCYERGDASASVWKARFAPREPGRYAVRFRLGTDGLPDEISREMPFAVAPSSDDGFLHTSGFWTLRFDSGKPFRGFGENVGWEARDSEDARYTYDLLLTSLSRNGANFIRTWMCPWNLPLEWKKVSQTRRYSDSNRHFNPSGIRRMDELLRLADSLGVYIMLALDSHNALIENNQWEIHNYNQANGGPAKTPTEFFTLDEARAMYKDRLRFLVGRWGYSTRIAAWEFFNEIDNAAFTASPENRALIPPAAITQWHDEMSRYLKSIDPYGHIVTTSVSHRDIPGMNDLAGLDLNQKHIYRNTGAIRSEILALEARHRKPAVIGEFAAEWDWNLDFGPIAADLEYDYKRGLWYGLFSPTPILPMSWWWEFFDARGMTPTFRAVREISDRMLEAGKGSFDAMAVAAAGAEAFAVRCGGSVFAFLLNGRTDTLVCDAVFPGLAKDGLVRRVEAFAPADRRLRPQAAVASGRDLTVPGIALAGREELVLILSPE
jgi:hypothetical protein